MTAAPRPPGEFDLIARIRARAGTARDDVLLGIGDDAALLRVPQGRELVVAMDTLNAGVHFPPETAPADIGWKALAVNLSDLAAMGAQPAWCTLSLSLPEADGAWLDAFLDGFFALADRHGVALVGGDTTRGPLSVCVAAHGFVEPGGLLRRGAARIGDDVWTTGTLGDAALALAQWRDGGPCDPWLRARLDRPEPRVAAALRLAGLAHACIDVSDGLFADLGHVCVATGVAAEIDIDALPASSALRALADPESIRAYGAGGGDDYELCFTAPPRVRADVQQALDLAQTQVTRIGRVIAGEGVRGRLRDGSPWHPPQGGFAHFTPRAQSM